MYFRRRKNNQVPVLTLCLSLYSKKWFQNGAEVLIVQCCLQRTTVWWTVSKSWVNENYRWANFCLFWNEKLVEIPHFLKMFSFGIYDLARCFVPGHKLMARGEFERALVIFEEAYKYLQNFLDYSSPEVEICSSDIDSCHLFMRKFFKYFDLKILMNLLMNFLVWPTVSWRYLGERAKRIKVTSGKYSLRYGEFLRHALASYLLDLEHRMPARGRLVK